jgi:DNA-binding transcriptional LysR family regulator
VVSRVLAGKLDDIGTIHVVAVADDGAAAELLHGNVDVVVTTRSTPPPELVATPLGALGFAAYASTSLSLQGVAAVAISQLPELADSVVVVRCETIEIARTICERRELACVLPRLGWPPLVELAPVGDVVTFHALHRPPLPTSSDDRRLPALVKALQEVLR